MESNSVRVQCESYQLVFTIVTIPVYYSSTFSLRGFFTWASQNKVKATQSTRCTDDSNDSKIICCYVWKRPQTANQQTMKTVMNEKLFFIRELVNFQIISPSPHGTLLRKYLHNKT